MRGAVFELRTLVNDTRTMVFDTDKWAEMNEPLIQVLGADNSRARGRGRSKA